MDAPTDAKINKIALNNYSTALRKEFNFVAELNSMACQSATERAWSAIDRFYSNCKSKKSGKKGFPRFQKDNRSVEYKTSGWALHPAKRRITFTDKKGIGEVKLLGKWDIHSYPIKVIKRVRLVKKADGYFCQFAINTEIETEERIADGEIGLDVGLEFFYSDSNGEHETAFCGGIIPPQRCLLNPRFLRKAEKAIKQAQRRIYKKEKGKNQRRLARARYARKHLKVSRRREEHAKRIARNVCKLNSLVVYEDLKVLNMVKNHCLAKSINDVSWSLFRQWLEYFASKFESVAVAVAPHYTSQKCSGCGATVKKSLSTRTHKCSCGCQLQRDVNAAINILSLGKTTVGQTGSNATGVGTSTLVGASLLEQVLTVNVESPCLKTGECQFPSDALI